MRVAIISDTQGNYPAFKAVHSHISKQDVDIKVHLGNVVGQCPYPNECIDLAISDYNYIVRGKADNALIDIDNALGFSPIEKEAAEWTLQNTSSHSKEMISNLSDVNRKGELLFVNNSPAHLLRQIHSADDAELSFSKPIMPFEIAFIGGTGVLSIWEKSAEDKIGFHRPKLSGDFVTEIVVSLKRDSRYIINVGSVGLPRDNDTRASYAIYDTETHQLTLYKVPYGIDKTIGRMQQRSFSTNAWMRLLNGR